MKKAHAGTYSPVMEAVLGGLFHFNDIRDAKARLTYIRDTFLIPKEQPENTDSVIVWIRDYALTEEEKNDGFKGNFAEISIVKKGEHYTMQAVKLPLPLGKHPQKKRKAMSCPDWGHPVIRASQKGHVYHTLEEVQEHLAKMHADFPKVSIPGNNRLFIMIYRKPHDGVGQAVKKYILLIKAAPEGGFHIEVQENTKPEKPKDKAKIGKFTSRVALGKKTLKTE